MNICKRSCARVHAAEKHHYGERIFNIRTRYVLRWRGACTLPQPRRRRKQRRSFCMSKFYEVMDDTAFFAQEAAQGAATSRLGVPRPRRRPRKKSCKRESGNAQDLWCAGCRNNRVCRLFDNNNTYVCSYYVLSYFRTFESTFVRKYFRTSQYFRKYLFRKYESTKIVRKYLRTFVRNNTRTRYTCTVRVGSY